jgi:hypothetical protein
MIGRYARELRNRQGSDQPVIRSSPCRETSSGWADRRDTGDDLRQPPHPRDGPGLPGHPDGRTQLAGDFRGWDLITTWARDVATAIGPCRGLRDPPPRTGQGRGCAMSFNLATITDDDNPSRVRFAPMSRPSSPSTPNHSASASASSATAGWTRRLATARPQIGSSCPTSSGTPTPRRTGRGHRHRWRSRAHVTDHGTSGTSRPTQPPRTRRSPGWRGPDRAERSPRGRAGTPCTPQHTGSIWSDSDQLPATNQEPTGTTKRSDQAGRVARDASVEKPRRVRGSVWFVGDLRNDRGRARY